MLERARKHINCWGEQLAMEDALSRKEQLKYHQLYRRISLKTGEMNRKQSRLTQRQERKRILLFTRAYTKGSCRLASMAALFENDRAAILIREAIRRATAPSRAPNRFQRATPASSGRTGNRTEGFRNVEYR